MSMIMADAEIGCYGEEESAFTKTKKLEEVLQGRKFQIKSQYFNCSSTALHLNNKDVGVIEVVCVLSSL